MARARLIAPSVAFAPRAQDQFGAEGLEDLAALLTHALGHDQKHFVAQGCADHGQADARVARRGLEDGVAFFDAPRLLGIPDHCQGDAVLDRAARIVAFQLGKDRYRRIGVQLVQFYERRVADTVKNSHGLPLLFLRDADSGPARALWRDRVCGMCDLNDQGNIPVLAGGEKQFYHIKKSFGRDRAGSGPDDSGSFTGASFAFTVKSFSLFFL